MENRKYLFILSKKNVELSAYEALSFLKINDFIRFQEFLLVNKRIKNFQDIPRLAYTKKVSEIIFVTPVNELKKQIDNANWSKIINKSYSIRINDIPEFSELEIADIIYKKLKHPEVNLENPDTKIEFYKIKNKIYATKSLWENHEKFEQRSSEKRPNVSPNSMNPRLARAMINIAGENEITDPFCGTGGIIIEAGLCKIKSFGYDIDEIQIKKAKQNLNFYKIKNFKIGVGDATKLKKKTKAIVTDPPYGKNTKLTDSIEKLYLSFLKNSEKITKKIVMSFPNTLDHKKIIKKTKWKIRAEFDYYIHKSMTKKIVVLNL